MKNNYYYRTYLKKNNFLQNNAVLRFDEISQERNTQLYLHFFLLPYRQERLIGILMTSINNGAHVLSLVINIQIGI